MTDREILEMIGAQLRRRDVRAELDDSGDRPRLNVYEPHCTTTGFVVTAERSDLEQPTIPDGPWSDAERVSEMYGGCYVIAHYKQPENWLGLKVVYHVRTGREIGRTTDGMFEAEFIADRHVQMWSNAVAAVGDIGTGNPND